MAQIVVRNIPDEVFDRFKIRAKAEGKSAEQLAREAIANAASVEAIPYWMGRGRPVENQTETMKKPQEKSRPKPSKSSQEKGGRQSPVPNDWQKDSLW